MVYKKENKIYGKYYTRKDRRMHTSCLRYKMWFHYYRRSRLKPIRKDANRQLRRYNGDVANNGWYKKYYDVMWEAF